MSIKSVTPLNKATICPPYGRKSCTRCEAAMTTNTTPSGADTQGANK